MAASLLSGSENRSRGANWWHSPIGPPPGTRFGDRFVRFAASPDGRHLAVVASSTGGPKVWVRPIGSLEYRAVDGTNGATFVFWKPDGREIGFFTGGKLKTVPLDAGGAVEVCDAPVGSKIRRRRNVEQRQRDRVHVAVRRTPANLCVWRRTCAGH